MKPSDIEAAWLMVPLIIVGALVALSALLVVAWIRGEILRRKVAKLGKSKSKRGRGTLTWL